MTDAEYTADREKIRTELTQPRRCGKCHVAYSLVPSGYATFRQVPVWSPPEDLPVSVCFKCSPPDWGGVSAYRYAEGERLNEQDEAWDKWIREIEELRDAQFSARDDSQQDHSDW